MTDLEQAQRLATILWEEHYKYEVPDWEVGKTMTLVLCQIDNMTAGMIRSGAVREAVEKVLNR